MPTLQIDEFVRTFENSKNLPFNFFLGAGSSISSGIPSASTLVWEWKRKIFLSNNPGMEEQFRELSLQSVKHNLQKWFEIKGDYPVINSPEEYSFYIEKCYPLEKDRRIFFEEYIRSASPYLGYKLLCLFAKADLIRSVWTTNFDGLVTKAAANFPIIPYEVGIDSQNRLPVQPQKSQLLCVSLHGDYRYDSLKNTNQELQKQETQLVENFISQITNNPFIVCGYSGRDKSIMDAFKNAYSSSGSGSLYWCGYGDNIPECVKTLLDYSNDNGHNAFFIPIQGFDELMERLALFSLTNDDLHKAKLLISENQKETRVSPFIITNNQIGGIIKSNAFEINCPSDIYEVTTNKWPDFKIWQWLDELSKNGKVCAVPFKEKFLCIGQIEEIKLALQEFGIKQIQRIPICNEDLDLDNGVIVSLLKKALTISIAKSKNLSTDSRSEIWEKNEFKMVQEDIYNCSVYESVILFLRKLGNQQYLILKPSLHIVENNHLLLPTTTINIIKNRFLGYQHNKEFHQAVNHWRNLFLLENGTAESKFTTYEFPPKSGSNFLFKIRRNPIFGSYKSDSGNNNQIISPNLLHAIKQKGLLISEPSLLFSNKQSTGYIKDNHPLRGLVNNRPYDFSLTSNGLSPSVKIGVVCPTRESNLLANYLIKGQIASKPAESEQDYLIPYPGFSSAFGLPIEIPQKGDSTWIECPDVGENLNNKTGSIELSRILINSIDSIYASSKPNVIIIFIPSRWKQFKEFHSDEEDFDLHDHIKAYCVQKGIATQFIEEETIRDNYQCRVWWWLSLAIYAKSMRTPWVVDSLNSDTAFVGLGFSVNHKSESGRHVVLGCGHIYNSHGEGLQYRLSPIQNPIWEGKNPFMSFDDARNLGETIRQLFFETKMKLPKRVVIHKQTMFRKEEQEGLKTGLGGINDIEMLGINFDSALRYVASYKKMDGKYDEDNFPVKRGTVLQIDDYSLLLWVHGVTESIKPGWKYFKGKRRIPTPILVKRYSGTSDVITVSNEIIALSKMDWNSADMYSQLPATIQSSRQIAKIGSLLQRFGPASYDYRLFI